MKENLHQKQDRLRALLEEDTTAAEAEKLLPLIQHLRSWRTHQPTAAQTDRLIARLQAELNDLPTSAAAPASHFVFDRQSLAWLWALLRSQLRVVRRGLWWASTLVMLLGVLVTLFSSGTGMKRDVIDLPLTLAAPLIAAIGLALLHDEETMAAQEIEAAMPTPPLLLTLVRLLLVFGFNLALAVVGSLILSIADPTLSLWGLISAWLAPMTFLSALAFLFSVIAGDSVSGALAGFLLWVALVGVRFLKNGHPAPSSSLWSWLPDMLSESGRSWLLLLALAIFALALWLSDLQPSFARRRV